MCLIISIVLMTFGINMFMAGDYMMGTGSIIASLFFITIMIRHILRVKQERGKIESKDCLSCNATTISMHKEDK